MNGCDRSDQMVTYYGNYKRKTIKWGEQIFYWITVVSQVSAHSLYNISHSGNFLGAQTDPKFTQRTVLVYIIQVKDFFHL
jgi:hypothetical protein